MTGTANRLDSTQKSAADRSFFNHLAGLKGRLTYFENGLRRQKTKAPVRIRNPAPSKEPISA